MEKLKPYYLNELKKNSELQGKILVRFENTIATQTLLRWINENSQKLLQLQILDEIVKYYNDKIVKQESDKVKITDLITKDDTRNKD